MIYTHRLRVRFTYFTIDNLRYDGCWPSSEQASHLIDRGVCRLLEEPAEVTVVKHSEEKEPSLVWTQGRWNCCGCEVVARQVEHPKKGIILTEVPHGVGWFISRGHAAL